MSTTSTRPVPALRGTYAAQAQASIARERRLSSAYANGAKPVVDERRKVETFPKTPVKTAKYGPCEPRDLTFISGRSISDYEKARRADLDVNIALTCDEGREMLERLGAFDLTVYKARKAGVSKRLMADFARETVCESLPAYDKHLLKLTDRLEDLPRQLYQAHELAGAMGAAVMAASLALEAAPVRRLENVEAVKALEVAATNAAQVVAALEAEEETTRRQIEWMRGVVEAEYEKIAKEQKARLARDNQKAHYERQKATETPDQEAQRKKRQNEKQARYRKQRRAARQLAR